MTTVRSCRRTYEPLRSRRFSSVGVGTAGRSRRSSARAGAGPDVVAELNRDVQLGEWSRAAETLETVLGHGRQPLAAALRTALAV